MALVTFVDDSVPYLNAQNLNNNFTQCNNIVDSGSNANGEYIKFSDGTMICSKTISDTSTFSVWVSPILFADKNCGSWPQTFTSVKSVQATNNGSQVCAYSHREYSTTSAGITRIITIGSASQERAYNLNILGIGKWK